VSHYIKSFSVVILMYQFYLLSLPMAFSVTATKMLNQNWPHWFGLGVQMLLLCLSNCK